MGEDFTVEIVWLKPKNGPSSKTRKEERIILSRTVRLGAIVKVMKTTFIN